MTLKDFFTLTELKDGLTTPTRVNELLTVMQHEKESIVDNIGEATRQWSAVATTIATTENKECLDLFIQLDGLWFIDKCLNDAQKLINDIGDGSLEELIVALLRTLERLQVDHHRSVGSGIGLTVQGLLGHSSLVVREKAKALCDKWTPVQHIDAVASDVNPVASSPGRNDNKNNLEQSGDQNMVSLCSDNGQQGMGKDKMPSEEVIMESSSTNQGPLDPIENEKCKSESTALTGISSPFEDVKEKLEIVSLTTLSGPVKQETLTSGTEVDNALESAAKTETKDTSDKDEDMLDGEESPDHRNIAVESNVTSAIGDFNGDGSQESSGAENPKTTSNTESDEGGDDAKENVGTESEGDSGSHSHFPKRSVKVQDSDLISKRPSDMELDYGMVDPLELARQVAIEVEQEVDSQEESCSTSTTEKEHQLTGGSGKEVSSGPAPIPAPGPSLKISPSPSEPMNDGKTLELPTTQISELAKESAPNAEKGFSGFDLNQEISSEEIDYPVDPFSTPISIVSASRAAAVDGLPVAPLQFEGTLGWKGSAATSAFRRIPEPEKTFSSSSSHNYSNQRLNRLDFDLNVSDSSDDKIEDFLSRDKMHITSYLPFRDEQEPSSSMKTDRLQLDLNSLGDSDTGIVSLDWKHDSRVASVRQNRPQSPSVSSSSSSMQPSFRNMDLNLNNYLPIPNTASLDNPFLGKLFDNKRDEPVISILGTQVEVNRKEFIPPLQPPNGRMFDPSVDFSLGRPGSGLGLGSSMPYSNLPSYGYGHDGFSMGPMYGPAGATIPYMVDLRGLPSIPPTFSQQTQPFIYNNMGGSNGAGPSRNNFDLNSGFMAERENNGGLRQFFNNGQASSSSVIGGKREEPDSGWELFPIKYKHQQPPWQ